MGAFPLGGGATYDFAKFSPKLHEDERIWEGPRKKFYYVDPSLNWYISESLDDKTMVTLNSSSGH